MGADPIHKYKRLVHTAALATGCKRNAERHIYTYQLKQPAAWVRKSHGVLSESNSMRRTLTDIRACALAQEVRVCISCMRSCLPALCCSSFVAVHRVMLVSQDAGPLQSALLIALAACAASCMPLYCMC